MANEHLNFAHRMDRRTKDLTLFSIEQSIIVLRKNKRKMIVSLYIYDFDNAYMKQLCYEILVLEIMKRYEDVLRNVEQNVITKC